jgi:hypothetical protein
MQAHLCDWHMSLIVKKKIENIIKINEYFEFSLTHALFLSLTKLYEIILQQTFASHGNTSKVSLTPNQIAIFVNSVYDKECFEIS